MNHHVASTISAGLAVIIAAAAFGACASTGGAPARGTVARGLASRSGAKAGDLDLHASWTPPPGVSLETPLSMDDAVAMSLWNNADFHAALAQLGIARADLIDAGLIRNPILSMLFPIGPKQLEATLNLPLEVFWQRPRRVADARLNAESIAEQLVAHGLRLVAEVRLAFVDVLGAERRAAVAAEQAVLARQAADLAAGRLRAGDISEFDARLARADAARLDAARLAQDQTHRLAVGRLRALLGLGADAPSLRLQPVAGLTAAECGPLPELIKIALASRPEVRAAELLVEAAGERAGLERSRIVALTAILDMNGQGREGFEAGPGLAMELPVLSRNEGRRARATAEIEQASLRYLAVRASTAAGVEAAWATLESARAIQQLLTREVGLSLAGERQQAQRMYELGEISLLTLLETRQRLLEIEQTGSDAAFAAWRAAIRLDEAVGRRCGA